MFFRRAAAMQKRLDRMEMIDKPVEKSELKVNFVTTSRSGNEVLKIKNLDLNIVSREL